VAAPADGEQDEMTPESSPPSKDAQATAAPPTPTRETTYDKKYKAGGFGYDEQRDLWVDWTKKHYIDAFDLRPGTTLVDVGCGDGFWSGVFHELGFVVSGFDLSAGGIEVAREHHPECEFEAASAEDPIFGGDRTFDVVFCRALSHLCAPDLLNPATLRTMEVMAAATAEKGIVLMSYYSRRNRENQHPCADHLTSDLCRLVEVYLDPWRIDWVGNYVQIGAKRRPAA
jgi:SAM-dependent methyltransferase